MEFWDGIGCLKGARGFIYMVNGSAVFFGFTKEARFHELVVWYNRLAVHYR